MPCLTIIQSTENLKQIKKISFSEQERILQSYARIHPQHPFLNLQCMYVHAIGSMSLEDPNTLPSKAKKYIELQIKMVMSLRLQVISHGYKYYNGIWKKNNQLKLLSISLNVLSSI